MRVILFALPLALAVVGSAVVVATTSGEVGFKKYGDDYRYNHYAVVDHNEPYESYDDDEHEYKRGYDVVGHKKPYESYDDDEHEYERGYGDEYDPYEYYKQRELYGKRRERHEKPYETYRAMYDDGKYERKHGRKYDDFKKY